MTAVLYMCINDPYLHIEDASNIIHGISVHSLGVSPESNPYKELSASANNLVSLAGINLDNPSGKSKTFDAIENYFSVSGSKNNKSSKNNKYDKYDEDVKDDKTNKDERIEKAGKDTVELVELIENVLDINIDEAKYIIKNQTDKIKAQNDAINRQNALIHENSRILEQLDHIGNISANLDALFHFEFFKFRFGHMPREAYDSITRYGMTDADDVFFIPSSVERNEVWGIYFTPRTKSVKVDSLFSVLHFERVRISDRAHGTPETARTELSNEIEEAKRKIGELNAELELINAETAGILSEYYEKIYVLSSICELKKKTVRTSSSFHLITWLPEDYVDKFSAQLGKLSTVVSPINSPSDMPGFQPPTLLKNFMFFKPFEQFLKMYGLPSYNEIDPTPFMALTYILFFGIMFADVGQGLVISVLGFLLWRLKHINLGRIAGILGLSSAFFGAVFGSVFGMEDIIYGYNPLDHINTILIVAVGLGVFTISTAIVINIINGIKQRNFEKVLFTHNSIAGLIFYWGVLGAVLTSVKFFTADALLPVLIGFIVLCLIIIYLREPLVNIIQKKPKIIPHSPAEFFAVNFFELFEIILSFLTNTVSFIRVGAFALNHVGMMSVVMILSQNADGSRNYIILILGNIIVSALEGLIVGIQCLRLEYYEIFGRFFEGGGRAFESSEVSAKNLIRTGKNKK